MKIINPYAIPGVKKQSDEPMRIAIAIKKLNSGNMPDVYTVVEQVVFEVFGKNHDDLKTRSRKIENLIPRQISMYLFMLLGKTTMVIGNLYLRDHTTVLNSRKRCEELLETKFPRDRYIKFITALKVIIILYPDLLPRQKWDVESRLQKTL